MPRRVIRLGLQPSQFSFQDEFGPLTNGLASAAQSFFEGGQRRAELDMARQAQERERAASEAALKRQAARDLAIDQQNKQQNDFREREVSLHEQEATDRRNEHLRDDIGATLKGAGEFIFGKNGLGGRDEHRTDAQLNHAQMMADRELDAEGVTTYDIDPVTHKPTNRHFAPGKGWQDAVPFYKKWGVLPPGDHGMDQPATPAVAPEPTGALPPAPAASPLADAAASAILPPTHRMPNGTMLDLNPQGTGYIPRGFTPAPTPNPGAIVSTGVLSDEDFNRDAAGQPGDVPPLSQVEVHAIEQLDPRDQQILQRIFQTGDPARIAEARRRLLMGR